MSLPKATTSHQPQGPQVPEAEVQVPEHSLNYTSHTNLANRHDYSGTTEPDDLDEFVRLRSADNTPPDVRNMENQDPTGAFPRINPFSEGHGDRAPSPIPQFKQMSMPPTLPVYMAPPQCCRANINPEDLPEFAGRDTQSALSFIYDCEQLFHIHRTPISRWTKMTISRLSGVAAQWCTAMDLEDEHWPTFRQSFLAEFNSAARVNSAEITRNRDDRSRQPQCSYCPGRHLHRDCPEFRAFRKSRANPAGNAQGAANNQRPQ